MSHPPQNIWQHVEFLFHRVLLAILKSFDTLKHVTISCWTSMESSFRTGFEAVKNAISVVAHALFTTVLVLLLWILVIYITCLVIFLVCRFARWFERRNRRRGERQPLLFSSQRRRRLLSWASSHSSSRLGHDRRINHRDLFRVEIGRRRQDQLRREQTRIVEVGRREERLRRQREDHERRVGRSLPNQYDDVTRWLQTSGGLSMLPGYGTISSRLTPPCSHALLEPPPPYLPSISDEPPPYSSRRPESPPAYQYS